VRYARHAMEARMFPRPCNYFFRHRLLPKQSADDLPALFDRLGQRRRTGKSILPLLRLNRSNPSEFPAVREPTRGRAPRANARRTTKCGPCWPRPEKLLHRRRD